MNTKTELFKTPIFNLPLDGMFTFDKKQPEKLTVIFHEKSFDIDLMPGISLSNKNNLTSMLERFDEIQLNVTAKDGQVYRVKMKTQSFTKITLLFVEQLPPVRLNPEMPKLELDDLGLTFKEYEQLLEYYNNHKSDLEFEAKQKFVKKKDSGLPRTVVYVPEGKFKGMCALLKNHGPMKIGSEVGLGVYNLVTYALSLDLKLPLELSQMYVFRSAKNNFRDNETNANTLLINATDLYSVGVKFIYQGPLRSREGTDQKFRKLNQPKDFIPQEDNVSKIGYLLKNLEGGTYKELLEKPPKFTFLEAIVFNLKYAHALATLHNTYKTLHRDQKPDNIFLTKDWDPKLGDFGFAETIGDKIKARGTPLFLAPEILKARNNTFEADPSSEIWSLGLILLSSIGGIDFLNIWENSFDICDNNVQNIKYMIASMEKVKENIIQDYRNLIPESLPLIIIIKKCLEMDPRKRIKAIDVFNRLGVIYYDLIRENQKVAGNLKNQCSNSENII